MPRKASRAAAVLHDQHRGAGPRRGARGARLRAGEPLRQLVRHARRAALCAPFPGPHAHRRAGRSRAADARARAVDRHRVAARAGPRVRALRGGHRLQRALPGPAGAVRPHRSPAAPGAGRGHARRSGHRREPARGRDARASPDDGADARLLAAHRVPAPAPRSRGGDRRQLRPARRAGRDAGRRARVDDRDGHAQFRRLRRRRAALRGRRGAQDARGDADGDDDAGRHGGDLRRLAARAGGRGFRRAARFRGAGAPALRRVRPSDAGVLRRGGRKGLPERRTPRRAGPGPRRREPAVPAAADAQVHQRRLRGGARPACIAGIRPSPFFLSFSGSAP